MNNVETTVRPSAPGLADKVVRLRERLRDPEWRRYGYLLLAGKTLGVACCFGVVDARLEHDRQPGARRRRAVAQGQRHRQPDQHRVDAGRRVPRLRHAGRLHDARSRLLPLARDRQRADGVRRRHLPLRAPLLRLGLRLHVRLGHAVLRHRVLLPAGRAGDLRLDAASRSSPSGSSSTPSPTPARRSPRAR